MSYIHLSLIRKLWIVNIILIHFVGVDEIVTSVQVRSAPRRGWWRAGRCGVMPPLPVAAPRGATHSTAKRGTPSTSAATLLLCCYQCFTPLLTRRNEVDLNVK